MQKFLVFYWYVPKFFWSPVYDLHIKNLSLYKDVFDHIFFAISSDEDSNGVDETITKLKEIAPSASFIHVKNNKEEREARFFYEHLIAPIQSVDKDYAVFFAHNKGVDSKYLPSTDRDVWVNTMYFFNLHNPKKIDELLEDPKTIVIGTAKYINFCPPMFSGWCKNRWHYTGTFYWLVQNRLKRYVNEHNLKLLECNGRYYAEGIWGAIFPDTRDECKCIGGAKKTNEHFWDYADRIADKDEKEEFYKIYGDSRPKK